MSAFDREFLSFAKAGVPSWRGAQMDAAFDVYQALEEPTGAEEDWRYVDYHLRFDALNPSRAPGNPLPAGAFLNSIAGSDQAQIVDGHVVGLDSPSGLLKRTVEMDERALSRVPSDHNKLAAAHASFASDGVHVEVPAGQPHPSPILIDVQSVTPGTASFPHVSVGLGVDAEASVVVIYRSATETPLLMVPNVDISVGDGARLNMLSIQTLDHAASTVVHQRARLGRDATGRLGEVGLGADIGRLDVAVDLEGDGCSSEIVGLYFGEDEQTLDYRMVINHSGKNTTSDVFLKGAVEDDSQSVFTGLLRIEKDATRTSTFETNRNLVLSENAKAHSVPNLEILCHDVICGHGSSVGPLEEDHLYYLRSRGLPRERAERLLIKGFFREVIDRLPVQGLESPIQDEVFRRFAVAQEEGRVS